MGPRSETPAPNETLDADGTAAPGAVRDGEEMTAWRRRLVDRSLEKARARSLERGDAFIDAALSLLSDPDDQRSNFTLQEVADAAGQSLRTFYQHFATKDELLLALLEESVVVNTNYLRQAVERHDDPLERLVAFLDAGSVVVGNPNYTRALAGYSVELTRTAPDEMAAIQAPVVDLSRELVADAVSTAAIPPCDPDVAAFFLVKVRTAYQNSSILGNDLGTTMPTRTDVVRFCIQALNGVLPEPEAKRARRHPS